jgi:hypothetical protein
VNEPTSIALTVLASLGGAAAILVGLVAWLGRVWATRIADLEKNVMSRDAEDRRRKVESLMRHYEKQIEQFYGPLFNVVHQIFVANHIKWALMEGSKGGLLDQGQRGTVDDYYHRSYFVPLHDQVKEIMRTKMYLVEGETVPDSFYQYLKHASQERDQIALWKQHGINTSFLKGEPWPAEFYDDIRGGFERAMRNYEKCVDGLREN